MHYSCFVNLSAFPADKSEQRGERLCRGYVFDYALLSAVDAHTARTRTDIAVIGIRHLSGTVDDASHHPYLESDKMSSGFLYLMQSTLQIEKSASATGARDIFGLCHAHSRGLKNVEFETREHVGRKIYALHGNT